MVLLLFQFAFPPLSMEKYYIVSPQNSSYRLNSQIISFQVFAFNFLIFYLNKVFQTVS